MSSTPSIKGTAFASAVEDLNALRASGRLDTAVLEARLAPEDLGLVEGKVLPGDWYPIDAYGRVLDLLGHVEGGGVAYHRGRGRLAAERLLRSGIYKQLDRVQRLQPEQHDPAALVGIMLTVGRTLYNFGSWEALRSESDAHHVRFEIRDVGPLPENARHTIHGFVEWTAEHIVGASSRVESRRPAPDRVVFDIHVG